MNKQEDKTMRKGKTASPDRKNFNNRNASFVKGGDGEGLFTGTTSRNESEQGMRKRKIHSPESPRKRPLKRTPPSTPSPKKRKDQLMDFNSESESEPNQLEPLYSSTLNLIDLPEDESDEDEIAREKAKESRFRRKSVYRQRTPRGQPLMRGRIELMLEKIKSDEGSSGSK